MSRLDISNAKSSKPCIHHFVHGFILAVPASRYMHLIFPEPFTAFAHGFPQAMSKFSILQTVTCLYFYFYFYFYFCLLFYFNFFYFLLFYSSIFYFCLCFLLISEYYDFYFFIFFLMFFYFSFSAFLIFLISTWIRKVPFYSYISFMVFLKLFIYVVIEDNAMESVGGA